MSCINHPAVYSVKAIFSYSRAPHWTWKESPNPSNEEFDQGSLGRKGSPRVQKGYCQIVLRHDMAKAGCQGKKILRLVQVGYREAPAIEMHQA